jgi:hypothetical protein
MSNDQRHKARTYATFLLPVRESMGSFTFGVIERFDSGLPYDMVITVDSSKYLTNPGYLKPPTSVSYYVSGRGALRTDSQLNTDLSLVWTKKIARNAQVFFRALAYNLFNGQSVVNVASIDTTVSSNASPGSYTAASLPAFNPFTTTPVQDVNWKLGPQFGQPTAPAAYQNPRSFNFSFGFRF